MDSNGQSENFNSIEHRDSVFIPKGCRICGRDYVVEVFKGGAGTKFLLRGSHHLVGFGHGGGNRHISDNELNGLEYAEWRNYLREQHLTRSIHP